MIGCKRFYQYVSEQNYFKVNIFEIWQNIFYLNIDFKKEHILKGGTKQTSL